MKRSMTETKPAFRRKRIARSEERDSAIQFDVSLDLGAGLEGSPSPTAKLGPKRARSLP